MPPSHLLGGDPARCSEAGCCCCSAAHHDICSSSCSLPRSCGPCVGSWKPCPRKRVSEDRKPIGYYISPGCDDCQKRSLEHITTHLDRPRQEGGTWTRCKPILSPRDLAGSGGWTGLSIEEEMQMEWGPHMQNHVLDVKSSSRKTRPVQAEGNVGGVALGPCPAPRCGGAL